MKLAEIGVWKLLASGTMEGGLLMPDCARPGVWFG